MTGAPRDVPGDAAGPAPSERAVANAAPAVAAVAAARTRFAEVEGTPVAGHVAVYDEVHDVLQGTLAGLGT
ncbi:MAG TPA: hypothetical protein VNA20_13500 [Frankiaceae bacterium]|nr:hypothetical protein [Frankiaceae bacterium]